ncbi:hypothetical protein D3C87_15670 [compost metagenome]
MFEFFGIVDIISFIGWLLIFIIGAFFVYENNKQKPEFKYYYYHFYFKILAGFGFALVYIFYYARHGDTVFYWQGALKLNQLFFDNPGAYFHELFSTPSKDTIPNYFNHIGQPPSWIYHEPNSWFICKLANFFSFFTFGSYLTLNLFFTVISSWISWRFFRFVNSYLKTPMKYNAIALLFVPSVAFWCSGIIKDTVALSAIFILTIAFFRFIRKDYKNLFYLGITIFFASYTLFSTRPFLLLATYIPFSLILLFKWNRDKPFVVKFLSRIASISLAVGLVAFYFQGSGTFGEFSAESVFETAEVIQKDMLNNTSYTGKKYDLGITEFTGSNLIKVIPLAIATALYRPFIWEADSVFMLLNGIENLVILILSIRIIWNYKNNRVLTNIVKNDFLLYAFLFVLILGFFVGLTSGLFGTLVRLKGPIIPFFLILITYSSTKITTPLSESNA